MKTQHEDVKMLLKAAVQNDLKRHTMRCTGLAFANLINQSGERQFCLSKINSKKIDFHVVLQKSSPLARLSEVQTENGSESKLWMAALNF